MVYSKVIGNPTTDNLVKFDGTDFEDSSINGTGTSGNLAEFDSNGKLLK